MESLMNNAMLEKRREYMRAYRRANRDRINAYHKAWRKKNPDKVKQYTCNYWQKKVGSGSG